MQLILIFQHLIFIGSKLENHQIAPPLFRSRDTDMKPARRIKRVLWDAGARQETPRKRYVFLLLV